jgi:hypothetical protein
MNGRELSWTIVLARLFWIHLHSDHELIIIIPAANIQSLHNENILRDLQYGTDPAGDFNRCTK